MIETEIHTRINEALAGRTSQRSFVDQFADGWAATVDGLGKLVGTDAHRRARARGGEDLP